MEHHGVGRRKQGCRAYERTCCDEKWRGALGVCGPGQSRQAELKTAAHKSSLNCENKKFSGLAKRACNREKQLEQPKIWRLQKHARTFVMNTCCAPWYLLKLIMCQLPMLLNLSIPDAPFPLLVSTLVRRRCQVKPAYLLHPICLNFLLWRRSFTVPGTKVAPFS
jgi:hypothetical protein